ncbi:MAG TPA: hypothetical protein VH682_00280 [Gemmataceae bacterium]|jgi:hypothetical protein
MKGNVNPFEPWRPAGLDIPPPLHAGRPWRPSAPPARVIEEEPLVVEPAKPTPPPNKQADKSAKRPPEPEGRQRRQRPCSLPQPLSNLRIVLGLFFVLGTLGLLGLGYLGGTHLPRVFTALLAVASGLTLGISVLHRRNWYVRLGWIAGGLALAGLAGWFVPTVRGVSLWSAYRQVDELRALPAGDVTGYVNGAAARKELVSEFPTFAEDVTAAEQAWLRRTTDAAIEDADRKLETDPDKALANLNQLNTELARLEHYALVRKELEAARQRALRAAPDAREADR